MTMKLFPSLASSSSDSSMEGRKKWYFVTKIVLTYCEKIIVLVIEEKLMNFKAEGGEFAKFVRALEQFIQTVKG